MKKTTLITLTLFLVSLVGVTNAETFFVANLDEAQANSGNGTGSMASGLAYLGLNDEMNELTMNITFQLLTTAEINSFHIHAGNAGMNGGVVFGLKSPNHDLDGDFMDLGDGFVSAWDGAEGSSTLASQLTNLNNEGLYFNAHTSAFPGGEIRGQIVPLLPGDTNLDGFVNLLDVNPFIDRITSGEFQAEADVNMDGEVNLLDVAPFIDLLSG